jgi:aryl-alcohol dehydrogenase-like predicted oxidoreductase
VGETFAGLPFEKGVEIVEMIKKMLPGDISMAQLALRWILDHDAVSTVIPGASSSSQVKINTDSSDLEQIAEVLHKKLRNLYDEQIHNHIRGPY